MLLKIRRDTLIVIYNLYDHLTSHFNFSTRCIENEKIIDKNEFKITI